MILAADILQAVMPRAPRIWIVAMIEEMPKWGVDSKNEIASFVAQVAHESNECTRLEENLNYSALRMAQVWKRFATNPEENDLAKRQPNSLAFSLERNPQALANYIYADANRSPKAALGNTQLGDGWRFHGRGPLQLTGRNNYADCGTSIGVDLLSHPEFLLEPTYGIRSALWFWKVKGLDRYDDDDDVRAETRRINGGETGLAYRQAYFNRCMEVLSA